MSQPTNSHPREIRATDGRELAVTIPIPAEIDVLAEAVAMRPLGQLLFVEQEEHEDAVRRASLL